MESLEQVDAVVPDVADAAGKALSEATARYADLVLLRAAIQLVPGVGGAFDALIGGLGSKIQQERLEGFITQLSERLARVEQLAEVPPTEELFDLMVSTFDAVVRTRSERKRGHFAAIVANQVEQGRAWEEADVAVTLAADLTDLHIEVLREAATAPASGAPFDGLRVVRIASTAIADEGGVEPKTLSGVFPQYSDAVLRMVCSELVARGLLHDEGIGRYGLGAMEYFVPTPLAEWFLGWITDEPQSA